MSELFWYPIQGIAAVTLGVAAGLLTRALFHWLDAWHRRKHNPTIHIGYDAPAHPREGDIWIQTRRDEYPPDPLHPYNTKERP